MKKFLCVVSLVFLFTIAIVPTAFAALQEYNEALTQFWSGLDGTVRDYTFKDLGVNNRNYTCGKTGATYNVTCWKKNLIGSSQVGGTVSFPTNKGNVTYCGRWKNGNPSGTNKFWFKFAPVNNNQYWVHGYTKCLSEQ